MNSAAFIVISMFTLAAALAAATLPNLMHAAFLPGVGVAWARVFLFPARRRIRRTCLGIHLHRRSGGVDRFHDSADPPRSEGTSWFQLERCGYRACCVWRFDLGHSKNAVAFHRPAAGSHAHGKKNRRNIDDRLRVAFAMRRTAPDCCADRGACPRNGGKAMTPTLQLVSHGVCGAVFHRLAGCIEPTARNFHPDRN